ncbi:hypothetical protein HPU229334_01365 [Helicobacter pullorum]|uniref:BdrR n=2 Tax=Helicobacter pullorum TaxID=35818 RepID=A0A0N1MQZ9_9HELI|nr:hypothetical protein F7P74_09225 [Helicobacter pullorum NCTC 12824]KPH56403.1 hypothetical protein HPU229334_01365 [Helicobacter pullorum]
MFIENFGIIVKIGKKMEVTVKKTQTNHSLSQEFKSLLRNIFKNDDEKYEQFSEAFEMIINDKASNKRISLRNLKEEVLDEIKEELVTKDYLRAELLELKNELEIKISQLEIKMTQLESENKFIRRDMKFYAIGIAVLMIILQPSVFDFIKRILG